MTARTLLLVLLGTVLCVGFTAVLLLQDPAVEEPTSAVAHVPVTRSEHAPRLKGTGEQAAARDFSQAGAATTLGAFRLQPPNVPAAAVQRLRLLVEADPELLAHLVRVTLGDEELRAELVPPEYPYEARQAAAWAIETLGHSAAGTLGARLETESDPAVRRAIYGLLNSMGAEAVAAVDALLGRARDAALGDRERGLAVDVLGRIGPGARAVLPYLLVLVQDADDPLFGWALRALYPVGGMTDDVRDAFVDLLATDVTALRPALLRLLEDPHGDAPCMALAALRDVGVEGAAAVRLVGRRFEDGEEDEEAAALTVLLASSEPGRAEVLEVARRTELMGLQFRAYAALQRGESASRVPTRDLLRLFEACDVGMVPAVAELLAHQPGGLPAGEALPLLRAQLRDPRSARRWAAAQVLPKVVGDDEAVLGLLEEALSDDAVAEAAIEALGRMSNLTARVVPLLVDQATEYPDAATLALARPRGAVPRRAYRGVVAREPPCRSSSPS